MCEVGEQEHLVEAPPPGTLRDRRICATPFAFMEISTGWDTPRGSARIAWGAMGVSRIVHCDAVERCGDFALLPLRASMV